MQENNRNSYGSVLKAIGLFGGVKVFQIIVSILKNKIVAVILGPFGIGVAGMLTSTMELVKTLTGFGLQTSSVREISQSYESGDVKSLSTVTTVLKKLVVYTGLLGTIAALILSRYLSIWSFGNEDYTLAFRLISIIALIDQLTVGETAILQGTFHYKKMAAASLVGSIVGFFISVPLYYIYKLDAIVPVIIVSSLCAFFVTLFYRKSVAIENSEVSAKEALLKGKEMLKLGLALAITGALTVAQYYLLRLFISRTGSIEDIGFYTAGSTIATSYIGIILTSMSSDYIPRLSASARNSNDLIELINRQTKLLVTIIAPLICILILFAKPFVLILYSAEFLPIIGMIEWMMLGMYFRAISWSLSYAQAARGEGTVFFVNELVMCIYSLIISFVAFHFFGLSGLGLAFFLQYLLYTLQMFLLCKKRFGFLFDRTVIQSLTIQLIPLVLLCAVVKMTLLSPYIRFSISAVITSFSIMIAYKELNKMIDVKSILDKYLRKKK